MLGHPEAMIAKVLGMLCQRERLPESDADIAALCYWSEIKD
jgi:hypothetical protein